MAFANVLRYSPRLNPLFFLIFLSSVVIAIFLDYGFYFWLVCYTIYFLSFALGVCMSLHRSAAHDASPLPNFLLYPFALLGSLAHVGTPLEWYLGHTLHHQYSDQATDPILPTLKGFNHLFGVYQPVSATDTTRLLFGGKNYFLMTDKFILSLSKYFYAYFVIVYLLIFIFFQTKGLLLFSIGNLGALVATSFLTHWSHIKFLGYRRFNLPDQSTNLVFMWPLFFGEELHNNHHGKPKSVSNATTWWEFDLIGRLMILFSKRAKE